MRTQSACDGKSFEKFVDEVSPKFLHDKRFAQGLVKYKNLKSHVKKMEDGKFGPKPTSDYIEEECSICLEPLGNPADVVNTTCKHQFHTFCLIESLGEGFCSSCPMCRNGVEKIVPSGVEGAQMRLLAKLRINIDQAEATHRAVYDELQKNAQTCISEIESVTKTKRLGYNGNKKKDLEQRATQIRDQLQLLEEYDRVNVMGFSKICNKVGRKLSQTLGDTLQDKYVNSKGYYKDLLDDVKEEVRGNQKSLGIRRMSMEIEKGLDQLRAQPQTWSARVFRRGSMDSNMQAPNRPVQKRGSMQMGPIMGPMTHDMLTGNMSSAAAGPPTDLLVRHESDPPAPAAQAWNPDTGLGTLPPTSADTLAPAPAPAAAPSPEAPAFDPAAGRAAVAGTSSGVGSAFASNHSMAVSADGESADVSPVTPFGASMANLNEAISSEQVGTSQEAESLVREELAREVAAQQAARILVEGPNGEVVAGEWEAGVGAVPESGTQRASDEEAGGLQSCDEEDLIADQDS